MANTIQIRRGAESGLSTLTLAVGELAFTTDTYRAYAGSSGGNKLIGEADFVKLSGSTMTGLLTLSGAPSSDLHAATKAYVDGLIQGIKAKPSVKVASTGNLTLSGTQTVDGIALSVGDRVLVKLQTTTSQNGVYVVASGAWTRATDADSWAELVSMFVWVEQGTANADSGWLCTVDAGGTLGTTAVSYVQFSGAGQITAGNGLTKSGNTLSAVAHTGIAVTASGIAVSYGTAAGTACQGNDSRLSDARTPLSHTHGNITNAGYIGTTASLPIITGTGGILQAGSFGTGAGTFCQGNDSRLSDARTPTAHVLNSASHTVSGLTTGHFLKATGATSFGFAAHGLTYSDVAAAPTSHAANAATYGYGDTTNAGHLRVGTGLSVATGTVSVSYGSAAGTAAQGNDARLHSQNTDTGTSSQSFQIGTDGPKLYKGTGGYLLLQNSAGTDQTYMSASAFMAIGKSGEAGYVRLFNIAQTHSVTLAIPDVTASTTLTLPSETGTVLSNVSTIDGGAW